jgi:hypothetical protein
VLVIVCALTIFLFVASCQQIMTPGWRGVSSAASTPNSCDVSRMSSASSDGSIFSALMEGAPPKIDEEEGDDESFAAMVTDDAYVARHTPCELKEQQRALGIVSETGQRSSVSAGNGDQESRPRVHSKGPSSTLVKLIENRASSVQTNPGFAPRRFPLGEQDLADVVAELEAPVEVYPLLADLEAAEEADLAAPSPPVTSAPTEEQGEKPVKAIKMIFKMRAVDDGGAKNDDGDDNDDDADDSGDDDDDDDGDDDDSDDGDDDDDDADDDDDDDDDGDDEDDDHDGNHDDDGAAAE